MKPSSLCKHLSDFFLDLFVGHAEEEEEGRDPDVHTQCGQSVLLQVHSRWHEHHLCQYPLSPQPTRGNQREETLPNL